MTTGYARGRAKDPYLAWGGTSVRLSGHRANAVRWQIWTALLVYLLLRYLAFLTNWAHSFNRLFTLVRTGLWRKWDLLGLLQRYGTADGHFRYLGRPEQAYFPGFV